MSENSEFTGSRIGFGVEDKASMLVTAIGLAAVQLACGASVMCFESNMRFEELVFQIVFYDS